MRRNDHIHQQMCHRRGHPNCDKCHRCPHCAKIEDRARIKVVRVSKDFASRNNVYCQTPHREFTFAVTRITVNGEDTLLCARCTDAVHSGTRLS